AFVLGGGADLLLRAERVAAISGPLAGGRVYRCGVDFSGVGVSDLRGAFWKVWGDVWRGGRGDCAFVFLLSGCAGFVGGGGDQCGGGLRYQKHFLHAQRESRSWRTRFASTRYLRHRRLVGNREFPDGPFASSI